MIKVFLFEFILIILPKKVLNGYSIELKVWKTGYQQILSNKYSGQKPSAIYINKEVQILRENKVYIDKIDYLINLEWENKLTNFVDMFSDLESITSVKMNYITGYRCNMSYMFYNCLNLVNFTYNPYNYNYSYLIGDTIGMFYNCISLSSFSFDKFYMNYYSYSYYYLNRNMSYMFFNCQKLSSISLSNEIRYIKDIKGMFYNCSSLHSINISKFFTRSDYDYYANISYLFYNCNQLSSLTLSSNFYIKDMNNIFYNCLYLQKINLNYFRSSPSYNVNMSRAFFNCSNLSGIEGNFYNIYISDTREMFFNCTSLRYTYSSSSSSRYDNIYIKIRSQNVQVNMSLMFYNCRNLRNIKLNSDNYILSNDVNSMFFNCNSLTSVKLEKFYANFTNMSYMFYNCKNLKYFERNDFKILSLTNTKRTMKGMFQNCESLISLNLSSNFYTKNVEIMWDMFKGCSKLTNLYINNFDTSKVTDMESMFEGCSNLVSLNISNFNTTNVQYMNKMFYNCYSLKTLDFRGISSYSLATMRLMFFNCSSLEYLNLFSLTEKAQSISEIFKGASTNFTFCIEENENIINIFHQLIYDMPNTKRDCSEKCYIKGKRISIPEKKLCCKNFEYNGLCYEKCPHRTKVNYENANDETKQKCENFTCPYDGNNKKIYYNYEQNDCIEEIPDGYYENDQRLKTIDKCHEDCETCYQKADLDNTHCKKCNQSSIKPHIYRGNCFEDCLNGKYTGDDGKEHCYCFDKRCLNCTEETILEDKCTSCAKGYYKKWFDENSNNFTCYEKNLEKHYLSNNLLYPCYSTCQTCNKTGNYFSHECLTCDANNTFEFKKDGYKNCYPKCDFYFYFDENNNYNCTKSRKCPDGYNSKIPEIGQCVKNCEENKNYRYKFMDNCYSQCPEDSLIDETKEFYCKLSCPFERPFMLKTKKICVSNCTINDRRIGECITNYFGNRSNVEIQDKILTDIENNLVMPSFDYTIINQENIIIEEKNTTYELLTTNPKASSYKTSNLNLAQCEDTLREYYTIPNDPSYPLYILKFDVYLEGKEGPTVEYRVFYPLENSNSLEPLDLTMCEGKAVVISIPANITGDPDKYNKNSAYYNDLCVSYASSDGFDKTLADRQKEYIENNQSWCEEDCNFVGYDKETGKVDCSCEVKFTLPLVSEIKIDKNKLYNFMNIKKIANFDVLKCWKLITSKVGIVTNLGFYLYIPSFITYFICIIIFNYKDFPQIKNQINDLVYALHLKKYIKTTKKLLKKEQKKKILKPEPEPEPEPEEEPKPKYVQPAFFNIFKRLSKMMKRGSHLAKNSIKTENKKSNRGKNVNEIIIEENNINNEKNEVHNIKEQNLEDKAIKKDNDNSEKQIKNKDNNNAPPIKKASGSKNNASILPSKMGKNLNRTNKSLSGNNLISNKNGLHLTTSNKFDIRENNGKLSLEEKEKVRRIMERNDRELNVLEYKFAVKYDKRSYFDYYFALLRTKHMIIRIMPKTDYNSRIIKIYLLLLNFCICFAVNALFFSDETMHKILEDGGDFNFIYQLPQIAYSTIITLIMENMLSYLALSEENILSLKHEKILRNVDKKGKEVLRTLQIKFIGFFILSFIFVIGFWYYVACFCSVYKNTQYHLIKDVLISFATSNITPLGLNLIPGLFRIPSLKRRKEFLFILSKIIQLF